MNQGSKRRNEILTGLALLAMIGCASDTTTTDDTAADSAAVVSETPVEAPAVKRTAEPRKWAHEDSDIPVNPRINFGHFDNGLRYAWAQNSEPEKRSYVYLHVDAGSLAEEEHEQGLAHFLEHMAFNGTKNFAPGTLIEWFQNNGMSFGADTNAHTSFSETVYKLHLPESDTETLGEGLKVLRDFADGMLLTEEEVQAEKGVIDGEQRERDSAGFRVMEKQLDLVFAGTRLSERLPIGLKEVRDEFTAEIVRGFYERWYRPEHMTLVLVGDIGDLDPVPLFQEYFGDMEVPEAPLEQEPGPGKATKFDHFFSIYESEIPQVSLSIDRLKAWKQDPVTVAEWTKDMPLGYARRMLNLRFSELAKKEDAPFMGAGASSNNMLEVFEGESISVTCSPEKWKDALAVGEQELRRALEHGFQQAELDEVRANALRGLDEAVEREATQSSRSLLGAILSAAENEYVPTNAETRRSVLKPAIEALTIEACHNAFVEAWGEGELSLSATGNLDLGETGGDQLRDIYEQSRKVAVEAKEETAATEFAYASDASKAGTVANRAHIEDLDFHAVKFDNGVTLNVKSTDFRENQVIVNVAFGEGALTLAPEQSRVMQMVAGSLVNGGGLKAHSNDDIRRLTAGKQVGWGFGIGSDRFTASGGTTAEDMLLQFELLCAGITAPGWREDGLVQMMRSMPMMYERMKHTHGGPAQMQFIPALFSNDPRYQFPTMEDLESTTVDQVREWLTPILADAPMEISVVGDLDVEETIKLASQTFGVLPKRRDWRPYEERRKAPAPKSGMNQTHGIETQIQKSLVLICFPTTDGIEMERRRRFNMLSTVVNDRLRLEVREKLGAAYSPGAGVQSSTVNPGVGMLMMQAMSDPEKVDTLVEACLNVAEDLATNGITDEELDRLREPILNRRRDQKRTNGFWLNIMSRAQSDPAHLDAMRAGDDFYTGVKAEDIEPLAAEYLKKDRASILIVNPEAKE
ncbi:MAG: M16 family metallopeptidase [Planctomycetota bacterium]|jgi:zinc protease